MPEMAREPKYRAYKAVKMTDGLQTWIDARFDMQQPLTAGDWEALRAMLESTSPQNRIAAMEARLATLGKSTDPTIRMHVAAIRAILRKRLSVQATAGIASRADLDLLKEADHLWVKIMVLRDVVPKAVMGAKHSETQRERRADKPGENWHDPDRNDRLRDFHAGLTTDGQRDATAQTAAAFNLSKRQVRRILTK